MTESRQEKLDRCARLMPPGLLNNPIMAPAAEPAVFFKTLGWYQWQKKNELTDDEKERFQQVYGEAYAETMKDRGVRRNEIERLINAKLP